MQDHFDAQMMQFISGPIIIDTKDFKDVDKDTVWVDLDIHVFNFLATNSELINKKFRKTVMKFKKLIKEKNLSLNLYYNLLRDFKSYE